MAQTPGGNYSALRSAPVNQAQYRVEMDLIDFAAAAEGAVASASTQFSADWPASGMIDGDRTHLNAGPASSADNGIGRSVWRGAVVSAGDGSLSPNEVIVIALANPIMANRLKVIAWPANTLNGNLGAIGLKDFLVEINPAVSGGSFSPWLGLADVNFEVGKPAASIANGFCSGNASDYNVFQDPALQVVGQIRITISKLQAAGVTARVVEVELTQAVDITDDVKALDVNRKKDYRLNHRIAGELNLSLINFDRRYSPSHVPTAAELAAGFFNPLLGPELEVRAWLGVGSQKGNFSPGAGELYGEGGYGQGGYGGASGLTGTGGLVQVFTGYLYAVEPDGKNRIATFRCRDYFKYFVGQNVTTKLQSARTLEFLAEYLANLKNFPSNLMHLDSSTITVANFMPNNQEVMKTIQDLADATGDGEVYIDELGNLFFRSYLTVVRHVFTLADAASFQAGTLVGTDATTVPGSVILAKSGGNYLTVGDWFSPLSPVLLGKVAWGIFQAIFTQGTACTIDFFLRATNDGGSTFTPWRPILNGAQITTINPWSQVQIWARFRSSDPTQTASLTSVTVKYTSRGGSVKVSPTPAFTFAANGDLWKCRSLLTSEVGGDSYIVTDSIVTATPSLLSAGTSTAWQGTNNGNPISPSNPLQLPKGVTTIQANFGQTQFAVPQTLNITFGTAVGTATLSNDPTQPTITITLTQAGTITALTITGRAFVQSGNIVVETLAPAKNVKRYGKIQDQFQSAYIDNADLASDISKSIIARFQSPLDYLPEAEVCLTADAQINDRATFVEPNQDIDGDFYVIGVAHSLQVNKGKAEAMSKISAIAITAQSFGIDPFKFDQGKFDSFRFGGQRSLQAP